MLGGLLAILAAATFGLNSVATRRGVLTGTVAQGLAITVPIAAPIFFVATFSTGNLFVVGGLSYKTIVLLGLAGITHFIVGRYANYRATKAMGANLTGPIVSSSLILTLILAIIFLDEIITSLRMFGIALILLGPMILLRSPTVLGNSRQTTPSKSFKPKLVEGYAFAILCAVAFGISPILIRAALLGFGDSSVGNGIVGGLIAYLAATVLMGIYLMRPINLRHARSIDGQAAKWFILTGLFVCASQMIRFMALAIAPVSVVSPIIQTSGIFRTIFGWFINREHEVFDAWVLLGIATSIIGAMALTLSTEIVLTTFNLPHGLMEFLSWHWP